ncbi:GntR family transcriptional regulator, partial [Mesorhizobium sp. M8A.F.Ca.ET.213.01.1.1]|uniref:GntR family transcriptional regulator n=1 Tax=Mesorhizobium sp. M8A.F.Ca.ET.213.01.1.1 TaxID=2563970 RepID=UPI001FDEDD39
MPLLATGSLTGTTRKSLLNESGRFPSALGYAQLASTVLAAIAERIATGSLAVGERLPPQREIARALGINVTTVTRALSTLQERGLLEARPGRGTTVAAREQAERPG